MRNKSAPIASSKKSTASKIRRALIVLCVVLIALAAAGFGWQYRQAEAVKSDKARFVQAENDTVTLSKNIAAVTGEPLKSSAENYCTRPHLKFREGPLSCDVGVRHFYGVNSPAEATKIYEKTSSIVGAMWRRNDIKSSGTVGGNTQTFAPIDVSLYRGSQDYQQVFEEYLTPGVSIKCTNIYFFYPKNFPPYEDYAIEVNHNFIVAEELSCHDFAKAEYYPVND